MEEKRLSMTIPIEAVNQTLCEVFAMQCNKPQDICWLLSDCPFRKVCSQVTPKDWEDFIKEELDNG